MRLGVDLGEFPSAERALIDELFIITQPAHLQKQFTEKLGPRSAICCGRTCCASVCATSTGPIPKHPAMAARHWTNAINGSKMEI